VFVLRGAACCAQLWANTGDAQNTAGFASGSLNCFFKNSQAQSETMTFALHSTNFYRKAKGLFFSRLVEKNFKNPKKDGPSLGRWSAALCLAVCPWTGWVQGQVGDFCLM